MDPSDIFSAWYGKDGPQNYSRWTNPAFHDIASQIERELDDTKRKALVRRAGYAGFQRLDIKSLTNLFYSAQP